MDLNCKNCGSNSNTNNICDHCGSILKEVVRPYNLTKHDLQRLRGDYGHYRKLEYTYFKGDFNEIDYAENCIIKGDFNKIKNSKNIKVIGDFNRY